MAKKRWTKVEDAYWFLRKLLDEQCGILVWDTEFDGPGVAIDFKVSCPKFAIVIGGVKSLKQRMFILAHEFGHCVSFNIRGDTAYVNPRKSISGEGEANKTAIKFLRSYDLSWEQEFRNAYNKMNEGNMRKKI